MEDAQHRHANEPKIPSSGGGSGSQMNMRGVFLHVMADALGSVVVIISAVIMWKTEWEYKVYVDPGNCVVVKFLNFHIVPLATWDGKILIKNEFRTFPI